MKKYIILISLIIFSTILYKNIIPGGILDSSILAKWMTDIINLNKIVVETKNKNLNIRVFWRDEDSKYKEVFSTQKEISAKINYSYGENIFLVVLDNKKYIFKHVKDNYWYSNTYIFKVTEDKKKQNYKIVLKIVGICGSLSSCSIQPMKEFE